MSTYHKSVLFEKALNQLNVVPGELYLDSTLGGGGHTQGILDQGGRVVALDVDKDAIEHVAQEKNLEEHNGVWETPNRTLRIYQKNFKDLDQVTQEENFSGILFDLGVSSYMLDEPSKGFSFAKDGPLDMRMDQSLAVTAADLINGLNEGELNELFTKLGEEPYARRLARDIVRHRTEQKIETTTQLAEIINNSIGRRSQENINPSTKVFMALRIAVNDELNNLRQALSKSLGLLSEDGRLVVISFHSLEDRIVKEFMNTSESIEVLTKKPIIADEKELKENPRARSAKMRVARKL